MRIVRLEPLAWCALAFGAALVQNSGSQPPPQDADSCQYLTAASLIRSTHRIDTSLVHFDTERSHGVMPAPLTWFPPGYPGTIALLSLLGCSYETAALWISIASFTMAAPCVWFLMRALHPSLWAARAAVFCWVVNSCARAYSGAAMSEPLFTLLALACLLFLVRLRAPGGGLHAGVSRVGAAAMAGLSYWVRYAGVLWVAACCAVLAFDFISRGKTASSKRSGALAAAALFLLVAPLMVRNMILVGDWRGGNNTPSAMPLGEFSARFPASLFHLFFGDAPVAKIGAPLALALLALLGLAAIALAHGRGVFASVHPKRLLLSAAGVLAVVALFYVGGIAAIASRSVISFYSRMYLPVLPHLIALSVLGLAALSRRLPSGGYVRTAGFGMLLCVLLGYAASNVLSTGAAPPGTFQRTREALLLPGTDGLPITRLMAGELAPGEVIAATGGQIAGYILNRPTLSFAGRPYSLTDWDEPAVRAEMSRFHARHLLIFRDPALDPVVRQSRFFTSLADGGSAPWLRLVAHNPEVRVYRVQ